MPGYVASTLEGLQHPPPSRPQHAPHLWTQPACGQKLQLAPIDDTPKLDKKGTHFVQSCVGSFTLLRTRRRLHHASRHK
jgi:hypothetical protein